MTGSMVARREVATALGRTLQDFDDLLPSLYSLGFPRPIIDMKDHWLVVDLLDWVTRQQEDNIRFVAHIERWILPQKN